MDANGAPLTDPTTTVSQALAIQWLQMNIVATDVVPVDQNTIVFKQVDSLGNTQTASGQSSFLDLNMTDFKSYTNSDFAGQNVFEPSSNDVFTSTGVVGDESLDIINYTIAVVKQ